MKTIKINYKKAKLALKNKFSKAVAPGQSFVLADMLSDDDDVMLDETINENLKAMKDIYKSSDDYGQLIKLFLASQQYSKVNIMNYFECSKCKVDNAQVFISTFLLISVFHEGLSFMALGHNPTCISTLAIATRSSHWAL